MTVTAVTVPVPPNGNIQRMMDVWIPTVGASTDPLATDANMQKLLNWCSAHGVNVVALDMFGYLGASNWSTAHVASVQKFIHYAHLSGISVYAQAGSSDWGHNQQWVMTNIIKPIFEYNLMSGPASNSNSAFDGFLLDAEYWNVQGYTSVEVIGIIDLMNAMRRILQIPVGFPPAWWSVIAGQSLMVTYNGVTQLEGYHLMDNSDFCAIQTYQNTSAAQISAMQPFFDYASASGLKRNYGLFCSSLTDSGYPAGISYWTGAPNALNAMETNHAAISGHFTVPATNCTFLGQAVEQYSSYSQMT